MWRHTIWSSLVSLEVSISSWTTALNTTLRLANSSKWPCTMPSAFSVTFDHFPPIFLNFSLWFFRLAVPIGILHRLRSHCSYFVDHLSQRHIALPHFELKFSFSHRPQPPFTHILRQCVHGRLLGDRTRFENCLSPLYFHSRCWSILLRSCSGIYQFTFYDTNFGPHGDFF